MQSTICKSNQSITQWNKVSKGHHLTSNTEVLISLYVAGKEDDAPTADTKAKEGEEPRRHPICTVCGENTEHLTKDYKYNKMARELKEKGEAARGSETSNHLFHNTSHKTVNN